jgi:hypothetical protein
MKTSAKLVFGHLLVCVATFGFLSAVRSAPTLTILRSDPLLLMWPTNAPGFALQIRSGFSTNTPWKNWLAKPVIVGTNFVVTNIFSGTAMLFRLSNTPQFLCANHLKQIGLAFKIWAMDNMDRFPFHVPVDQGGTWEKRAIGPDDFDTNAYLHFQAISNELVFPDILVCPSDIFRVAAVDFPNLLPQNVTYRLRTGDAVNDTNPGEVLAVCPIDGNRLYCDGSVKFGAIY